jgi:hypothetical protein
MKKLLFVVALAALTLGGLSSCKKCSTCKGTKTGTTDVSVPELCGKKSEIDTYEKNFKTTYEALGYTVTCGK